MNMTHGNGKSALADRLKHVEKVEEVCGKLADALPTPPSMEHCPNKEVMRPFYTNQHKVDTALLSGMSVLAGCRADEIRDTLSNYETKPGMEKAPDTDANCSEVTILRGLIKWKVRGKTGVQMVVSGVKALTVVGFLFYIAVKTGKIDLGVIQNQKVAKASVHMLEQATGVEAPTNLVSMNGGTP